MVSTMDSLSQGILGSMGIPDSGARLWCKENAVKWGSWGGCAFQEWSGKFQSIACLFSIWMWATLFQVFKFLLLDCFPWGNILSASPKVSKMPPPMPFPQATEARGGTVFWVQAVLEHPTPAYATLNQWFPFLDDVAVLRYPQSSPRSMWHIPLELFHRNIFYIVVAQNSRFHLKSNGFSGENSFAWDLLWRKNHSIIMRKAFWRKCRCPV